MVDEWIEDIRTGEAWRLDQDVTRPVYKRPDGRIEYRDGLSTCVYYKFYPCCPKRERVNIVPEVGEQLTIFDFIDSTGQGSPTDAPKETASKPDGADGQSDRFEETVRKYSARGYRPRIADALARRELGMDNPDARILDKFHITGEDKT